MVNPAADQRQSSISQKPIYICKVNPAEHTALWEQFRQGDAAAFAALYKEFYHDLLRFGINYCGDPELTRDEINQQFLQLWDRRTSLTPVEKPKAYLLTSFRNRLVNRLKRDSLPEFLADAESFSPSWEQELIGIQDHEQLLTTLKNAIRRLAPRQREIVFMRFYQGLSVNEIAEKTGLSTPTIYNTLQAAMKRLRAALGPRHAPNLDRLLSLLLCVV